MKTVNPRQVLMERQRSIFLLLNKDIWVYCIAPRISPIDLSRLVCVNSILRRYLQKVYLKVVEPWKERIQNVSLYHCLGDAAREGHVDLVEYLVSKGANDWDSGMESASRGGHLELVKYFVSKGANDWVWGMTSASTGGHLELVKYFESKTN